jgi:hypothetical protein
MAAGLTSKKREAEVSAFGSGKKNLKIHDGGLDVHDEGLRVRTIANVAIARSRISGHASHIHHRLHIPHST